MTRPRRLVEVFAVTCWSHHGLVEIPRSMVRGTVATCPRCNAALVLIWEPAEQDDGQNVESTLHSDVKTTIQTGVSCNELHDADVDPSLQPGDAA